VTEDGSGYVIAQTEYPAGPDHVIVVCSGHTTRIAVTVLYGRWPGVPTT
jgi:hypothetical protein